MHELPNQMGASTDHWIDLEQNNGNIARSHGTYAKLFPWLTELIAESEEEISLADFGCGTNDLARTLLYGDPKEHPALACCIHLQEAREKIRKIVGFEVHPQLISQGRKMTDAVDTKHKIEMRETNLEHAPIPADDNEFNAAVSVMTLMHLAPSGVSHHLEQVRRVLSDARYYAAVVLDPDYEQQKYLERFPERPPLYPGQKYEYPHGNGNDDHLFWQYWRPADYYTEDFNNAGLDVKFNQPICIEDRQFLQSHPQYCSRTHPFGLLFGTTDSLAESKRAWYTIDIAASTHELAEGYLTESVQRFCEQHGRNPVPHEYESLKRAATFRAHSDIYSRKYGPESTFALEHKTKLDNPKIAAHFRASLRELDVRPGNTIVSMGVNDGYELHKFNEAYPGQNLLRDLNVYGIDISDQAIAQARKEFPGPNFHFIHGDGITLSGTGVDGGPDAVPSDCADIYMSITSMQSTAIVQQLDATLESAVRSLKTGNGKMLIAIPNCHHEGHKLVRGLWDATTQANDQQAAYIFTAKVIEKLQNYGFDIRTRGDDYIFVVASQTGFVPV